MQQLLVRLFNRTVKTILHKKAANKIYVASSSRGKFEARTEERGQDNQRQTLVAYALVVKAPAAVGLGLQQL